MSPNRAKHGTLHRAIRRGQPITLSDIQWLARKGELLAPAPLPVDTISSRKFGPQFKVVQMERIRVIEPERPMITVPDWDAIRDKSRPGFREF